MSRGRKMEQMTKKEAAKERLMKCKKSMLATKERLMKYKKSVLATYILRWTFLDDSLFNEIESIAYWDEIDRLKERRKELLEQREGLGDDPDSRIRFWTISKELDKVYDREDKLTERLTTASRR